MTTQPAHLDSQMYFSMCFILLTYSSFPLRACDLFSLARSFVKKKLFHFSNTNPATFFSLGIHDAFGWFAHPIATLLSEKILNFFSFNFLANSNPFCMATSSKRLFSCLSPGKDKVSLNFLKMDFLGITMQISPVPVPSIVFVQS